MEKDTEKTNVVFIKAEEPMSKEIEVVAVFPDERWNGYDRDSTTSYVHYGQHAECSLEWAKGHELATPEEYEPLKRELEDVVGYNLNVLGGFAD